MLFVVRGALLFFGRRELPTNRFTQFLLTNQRTVSLLHPLWRSDAAQCLPIVMQRCVAPHSVALNGVVLHRVCLHFRIHQRCALQRRALQLLLTICPQCLLTMLLTVSAHGVALDAGDLSLCPCSALVNMICFLIYL